MSGKISYETIDKYRNEIKELALKIWSNPEGAFKEFNACKWSAELLESHGFKVEIGTAGVPTAIKASFGEGSPVIGFLGEYDALPGLSQELGISQKAVPGQSHGHGCGHNILGSAHVGAVIGLKEEMVQKNLKGTIVFYGCPAEEVLTGKSFMARGGAFKELDAAISFHPFAQNEVDIGNSLALNSVKFHFVGKTAHAGGDPHNGRSALDAVELMNVGANYLREHVTTDVRLHYIITDGGTAPNIVPDHATVWYYVRAPKRETVEEVYARLIKVAEGAAHMTETKLETEFLGGCYQTLNNYVLADVVHKAMIDIPQEPWSDEEIEMARKLNAYEPALVENRRKYYNLPEDAELFTGVAPIANNGNAGSTDVGDVAHIAPTIFFSTACENLGAPGHSWQITSSVGSSIGEKGMIYASKIMAKFALDLIHNPEILKKAKEEFDAKTGGKPYKCPIPEDVKIPE